ncbi:MAG: hypothetical protein OEM49_06700 [Myxococcales bacterium]|nr:hypothetical protein [Myxococcales bacterium]MDH5308211.1 hypothetical protein [Myxococcales bacterium]MDH5568082.1 hypothetical protein [Myxococcales bacterium]
MGAASKARRCATAGALLLALGAGGACSTPLASLRGYQYFTAPAPNDPWSAKIRGWQERERSSQPPGAVAIAGRPGPGAGEVGDLRSKYDLFRTERKRALARDLAAWIQQQARDHYVSDGPIDHWATLAETFQTNGDDCDGLELLVFNFLRELGFSSSEVFRAIVVRQSDGQHHMVTLWFEDPEDPWVIDPTGAMTLGMPRMSEVPEWAPLKVFTEERDFTVLDTLHTAQR